MASRQRKHEWTPDLVTDIEVLVPSRGRPKNVWDLESTFRGTASYPSRHLLTACIDDDDPEKAEYYKLISGQGTLSVSTGQGRTMNEALNWLLPGEAENWPIIGFVGDDHRFRTDGWDVRISKELTAMGTGIVYGNDLFQGQNLPTAVFMTSDIIVALGYIAPPCLDHFYLDNYWRDLGIAIDGLRYLDDVIIEHMHPEANKAAHDAGYARVNTKRSSDLAAYQEFISSGAFDADVEKVRAIQGVR